MKRLVIVVICALLFIGLSKTGNAQTQNMTKKEVETELAKQKATNKKTNAKLTALNSKMDSLIKVTNKLQAENAQLKAKPVVQETKVADLSKKVDSLEVENADKAQQLKTQSIVVVEKKETLVVAEQQKIVETPKEVKKEVSTVTTEITPIVEKKEVKKEVSVKADTIIYTSGRFFNIKIARTEGQKYFKKDYFFSVQQVSDIVDTIIKGKVITTKWYTISMGIKVQILQPVEWMKLVMEAYVSVDNSINDLKKLAEAIKASEATIWTKDMSKTRNYYWSQDGKRAYLDGSDHKGYSGAAFKIPVIVYKGSPVIKRSCLNPQILIKLVDLVSVKK